MRDKISGHVKGIHADLDADGLRRIEWLYENGGKITVGTERGANTVPVAVTDMPDRVVWLPANSAGRGIRRELAAGHGTLVTLRSAE